MKYLYVLLPVASVVGIYVMRLAELKADRDTIPGVVKETLTLRLFMLAGTLMVVGSITEFFVRGLSLAFWSFALGWICALGSFAVRRRAIAALGQFWSLHVEIRENHEFVQGGPFRFVRHPTYFSMILELLGLGLLLNAVYTPIGVALIFIPTLVARVRIEETALVQTFGDAYRAYQRSTPALIPYRFSFSK